MKDQDLRFKVEGRGDFPIDMLRYDRAVPWTSIDSSKIKATFDSIAWVESGDTVELVGKRITVRRWESFGWKVVGVHRDTANQLGARRVLEIGRTGVIYG